MPTVGLCVASALAGIGAASPAATTIAAPIAATARVKASALFTVDPLLPHSAAVAVHGAPAGRLYHGV